ncbi:putative flavin monooxygenase, FAD/NAD(P)-binding domain superfamily [Helianthus annuus]|uniref:Flavin-containing monooxygenase n=1 Tax=Helianthus annuus TaxID=4232 RepID=A0A251STB6_HELAN|nr:flavin-containing monooxygenase FMO GS-OX-like 4 [Helianthus annuus]KAF5772514.1 putative flavin monooxygenase, FAD/NAD(P)-binding domain superfamily [Helianthus annuus]KAJ0496934.1 putative flavin monooxygenase, FAD/NAD(P)-binding domain superfamily [Helianthus annuus]KAJ0857313.1 putative flavin monooxygenase, FAD/NAD(P)-binding domain superfamily [Helianthus annuus]
MSRQSLTHQLLYIHTIKSTIQNSSKLQYHPPLPSPMSPITACDVAVIGAGAAGLAAARQLRREGHNVVVFEKESQIGGIWVYNNATEPDPLGLDPTRPIIHSSLYSSLRTNLPRETMGFREYPFVAKKTGQRDPRRFPGHVEVLEYLKDYASEFGLSELVRFETEVSRVWRREGGKWEVRFRKRSGGDEDVDEDFDAVVVCNGHYTEPRIAFIPGVDRWPGKQIHSHNYRVPEPFQNKIVVLIGSSASAVDISREIASVANEVHIASWSNSNEESETLPGYDNVWLRPMIESANEDGTISFPHGFKISADIILHCTGYKYHFPFLDTQGIVTVDDNRVGPLYKHVFPPSLAPWLSFVGLPWKIAPFPQFELQCEWIAGILSGRISLPSQNEMMKDVEAFYDSLQASGVPKRYTHNMTGYQFEYNDWLATQCGAPKTEEWRKKIYDATSLNRKARPETYREEWEDEDLVLQAYQDFAKQVSCKQVS